MNIVFSCGDCNGIGLEVMIKAILRHDLLHLSSGHTFHLAVNTQTLREYISHFDFPVKIRTNEFIIGGRACPIIECSNYSPVNFGSEKETAGRLAAEAVETALAKTIAGEFDAMVTLPINKYSIHMAGWQFPGHTEMLAARCGTDGHLMVLFRDRLRVALATIHIPIKNVPGSLSVNSICERLEIFNHSLAGDFGIGRPRIAVLALNPHAGEEGDIGAEEIDIIIPSINKCRESGIDCEGPFPADGFFAHGGYKEFDGIFAMYHDQGLIPLKLLASGGGVNFTAGLPVVRTSPDHGTAFSIAGKDAANETSCLEALEAAVSIALSRKKN